MSTKIGQFTAQGCGEIVVPTTRYSTPVSTVFQEDIEGTVLLEFQNLNGIDIYLNDDTLYTGPFEITKNQSLLFKYYFPETLPPGIIKGSLVNITHNETVFDIIFGIEG